MPSIAKIFGAGSVRPGNKIRVICRIYTPGKELFVEVFSSKNDYIDLVMRAMDRTDEIEALLCDGKTLSIPGWTYDGEDGDESDEAPTRTRKESSSEVDVDELVLSCLNLVTDLNEVDRSKYIKVFSKDEGLILGIQHTKLKNYAKENDKIVPKFQAQSRFYPSFVTLKTEAFTKVKSTSSRGASNTQAGFCTSVIIGKLNMITRKRIQELFGLTDDVLLMDDDISEDPLASQDYPMFSQTQSEETLQVCEFCQFTTRSKSALMEHLGIHPSCVVCKKVFASEALVVAHIRTHDIEACSVCNVAVLKSNLKAHMDHHQLSDKYRMGLDMPKTKPKKKKQAAASGDVTPAPRLNSFHIFCRAFREEKRKQFPGLDMLGINKLLSQDWSKLTLEEKAAYKPKKNDENSAAKPLESHSTITASVATCVSTNYTQSQIKKCGTCGRMFLDDESLSEHKRSVHGVDDEFEAIEDNEDGRTENVVGNIWS